MTLLLLDVNETLSDLAPLGDLAVSLGAPPGLAVTWFAATLRDGFALAVGGDCPAFTDLARAVGEALLAGTADPSGGAAQLVAMMAGGLRPHPDVVPGLRALRVAGHRLATLSVGSAEVARDLVVRAGEPDLVAAMLGASEVGYWKPHPEAYRSACRALGAEPAETMMVAVHPWDLDGARRVGMQTAYIDRTGAPWPATFARPDITVPDLTDLEAALA